MKFQIAAIAALVTFSAPTLAQQFKPADQIKYRQSAMQVLQRNAGILNAMAKGDVPYNKETATASAELINLLAKQVGTGFAPGSESGAPTRADMKVWSDASGFKAVNDKFIAASAKLAAANGDLNGIKAALGDLGQSCKGCHDDYRLREARN